MRTCEYAGEPFDEPRSHPWFEAVEDPHARYYDLTRDPARIRDSLEDFLPWDRFPAVTSFYQLLERLNQPGSALESNDCAFTGPHLHQDPMIGRPLQCSGRVMVLFRELAANTDEARTSWLKNELHVALTQQDPAFEGGIIGTTQIPARFLSLPEHGGQQLGSQLMISFWAWGEDEAATMHSLARLMTSLSRALALVAKNARRWA